MPSKFTSLLLALVLASGFLVGCDGPPPSDKVTQDAQERLSVESNKQVGLPGIDKFTEKKLVAALYELRDKNVVTYTYIPDMQGHLWHICDSFGYGLPYGVQFSNPEKITSNGTGSGYIAMPQSEPNGLFMPATAEGTWVFCANPDGKGEPKAMYIEPRIIVSPFPLNAFGEYGKVPAKAKAAKEDE